MPRKKEAKPEIEQTFHLHDGVVVTVKGPGGSFIYEATYFGVEVRTARGQAMQSQKQRNREILDAALADADNVSGTRARSRHQASPDESNLRRDGDSFVDPVTAAGLRGSRKAEPVAGRGEMPEALVHRDPALPSSPQDAAQRAKDNLIRFGVAGETVEIDPTALFGG